MTELDPPASNAGDLPRRGPTPPPPPPPPLSLNIAQSGGLQNIGGIARAIGTLMMVIIPLDLVTLLVSFGLRSKARDLLAGSITENEFKRSFGLNVIASSLTSLAMIAAFVLTIIWMYRMARNNRALGRIGTWTPGWAIGGWFLPACVLYVIPYLMLRELWKQSEPTSSPEWKKNPVAPLLTVWWVLYGLLPLLFITVTFSGANIRSQTTVAAAKNFNDNFTITMVSTCVQIAAAVAYLMLVRQLTARHRAVTREA
ncbi:MAG: DUF4328 domain-containing protein [Actinobacteria bacterium]|nr:DUF4328 domain-containing protein [Actinomycetota bacterium]